MKILKKIICGILCIAVLACVSPVFAAEETHVYGTEAIGLINALEIAEYTEENLSEGIARGEFFKLAAIAGGYGQAPVTAGRFSDLTAENEYAPYIEALANAGIISSSTMGRIYPDGAITLQDASAIMVKILGYSIKADDKGGYPVGYRRVAVDLELLAGIDADENTNINKGMAVQLIYNALDTKTLTQAAYGSDFKMVEGGTLAEAVFKVKRVRDVLDAVDITRLTGENDVDAFYIEIGGTQLETRAIADIYSYLGYTVDVFYKELSSEAFDKVIYIQKTADNIELSIDVEDIVSISNQKVRYSDDESNKTKTAAYKKGIPVIYNGVSTKQGFEMSMITGKLGKVRLLDNDGSGSADVVFVDVYNNYVVSYVDGEKYIMYDLYNPANKITLDTTADDPYTIIYDDSGSECKITKIIPDNVVSIYQSAPDAYQQYIRAYINSGVVEGTITETRDNEKYVTIEDTEYKINDECTQNDGKMIEAGAFVKLYLDISGKVARVVRGEQTDMQYGYIMGTVLDGSFDKVVRLRIFTRTGEFTELVPASKFMLDGVSYKNTDTEILNKLHAASVVQFGDAVPADKYSSVISYSLNDRGEISAIDTVLNGETGKQTVREDKTESNDAMFTVASSGTTDYFRQTYNTLGPKISIDENADVMLYPSPVDQDLMDEELYLVAPMKNVLIHDKKYSVNAFYTDSEVLSSDFIGIVNSADMYAAVTESNRFAVVKYISKGLDVSGTVIDVITVISSSGTVDIPVRDGFTFAGIESEADSSLKLKMSASELKTGDIIRYNTDIKGYVSYIDMYYRASSNVAVKSWSTSYRLGASMRKGFVYDTFSDGYMVYFTNSNDKGVLKNITSADCELVMTTKATTSYYKYGINDKGEDYVENSSNSELKSYRDTGMDCSEIIIQQNYGTPMSVLCLE